MVRGECMEPPCRGALGSASSLRSNAEDEAAAWAAAATSPADSTTAAGTGSNRGRLEETSATDCANTSDHDEEEKKEEERRGATRAVANAIAMKRSERMTVGDWIERVWFSAHTTSIDLCE